MAGVTVGAVGALAPTAEIFRSLEEQNNVPWRNRIVVSYSGRRDDMQKGPYFI